MDAKGLETLLVVALVAALAPIVVAALPGPRIPQVVVLIFAGILIGPHGLGLADTASIKLLANVGLGFLFLLAGYELDPRLLREQAGQPRTTRMSFSALVTSCGQAAVRSPAGRRRRMSCSTASIRRSSLRCLKMCARRRSVCWPRGRGRGRCSRSAGGAASSRPRS